MGELSNARHERFAQELAAGNPAQALARGSSAAAAYGEVGFKPHRHNAATLARKKHISVRVSELQEEQLAIHQQSRGGIGLGESLSRFPLRSPSTSSAPQ